MDFTTLEGIAFMVMLQLLLKADPIRGVVPRGEGDYTEGPIREGLSFNEGLNLSLLVFFF